MSSRACATHATHTPPPTAPCGSRGTPWPPTTCLARSIAHAEGEGVHLHLERHWPALNVETDPWPYIKDERDIDGLTSSWQTGNPDVDKGDAGKTKFEEDSMNAEDRTWLQGTLNEAEKRIKADTGVKIEAAMSAIAAVGEAVGKIGTSGLAGADRVWMQSVLNAAEKRIKAADQAVVIDADTLREALEGAGLAADVADELAKRLTA